jgi:hypothetical protein
MSLSREKVNSQHRSDWRIGLEFEYFSKFKVIFKNVLIVHQVTMYVFLFLNAIP